jgi:ubiquinone biosynthesis protein
MRNALLTLQRLLQLLYAIFRFFLLPRLTPAERRPPRAECARRALEYLSGAWIKVGQALALRFDLLPAEYCNEFLKLLNQTNSFEYQAARRIVKEELGRFPEELFASFDETPLAAASIGQVHKAVTFDGTVLAVKVQRPGIGALFQADFLVMRVFASGLDLISVFGGTSVRSFVDEFSRWTEEEIDFLTEARNAHRSWLFSQGDDMQFDARVRFEYSSKRIIATEFMHGISLLDIVQAVRRSDRAYLERLAASGHDIERIGRHICWNMLNQMFCDGFFHADLHPANLFVLQNDAIGYVDYGIVGRLSEVMQSSLRFYTRSLFQGNFDAALDELLRWVTPSPTTDLDQTRQELTAVLEDYRYGLSGPLGGKPLQITSNFIINIMSVIRRHRLALSQSLTLYFKAVLTTDAVVFALVPNYNLFSDVRRFLSREATESVKVALSPGRIAKELQAFDHQLTQMLSDFNRTQSSGRIFEISLETLRTRLVFYGVWAIFIGATAYITSSTEIFSTLRQALGAGEYLITYGLYAAAAILLLLMWRQGRKLTDMNRRPVARGVEPGE